MTMPLTVNDELDLASGALDDNNSLDEERTLEEEISRDETPSIELLEVPSFSPAVKLLEDFTTSEDIEPFDTGSVKKLLDDAESSPQEAK
jgi:hypothetical protein